MKNFIKTIASLSTSYFGALSIMYIAGYVKGDGPYIGTLDDDPKIIKEQVVNFFGNVKTRTHFTYTINTNNNLYDSDGILVKNLNEYTLSYNPVPASEQLSKGDTVIVIPQPFLKPWTFKIQKFHE